MTLRHVAATRYVLPLREGGSLPALVEADDDGIYVVKLRGAGQGVLALVAELLVGELARTVGLDVPELVTLDLDPELAAAEPDPEIQELLQASAGLNVALDFLPGSLPVTHASAAEITSADRAAEIVWLDALTLNIDRTARNPNLLAWHGRLWLIDHGAALYPQHGPRWPAGAATMAMPQIADHMLLGRAGSIADAHERLAPRLGGGELERLVSLIPDDLLGDGPAEARERYRDVLASRLADGAFATEAETARRRRREGDG